MNTERRNRAWRGARLPTVLLTLALAAGFASVGHAQDVAEIVITAQKPDRDAHATLIREEMQSDARLAARETRIEVASELSQRLNRANRRARITVSQALKQDHRG